MRRRRARSWLPALLLSGLTLGCQLGGGRLAYPNDPLLLVRKPREGKSQDGQPLLLARAEPVPPPAPRETLTASAGGSAAPR